MRLFINTPFHAFEAVTVYPDADLDGDILVIDETGEPLVVHGWQCDLEVMDESETACRPANVTRRWQQVERDMLGAYPDSLPHIAFPAGWDSVDGGAKASW